VAASMDTMLKIGSQQRRTYAPTISMSWPAERIPKGRKESRNEFLAVGSPQ
jgi:hypothetical protein